MIVPPFLKQNDKIRIVAPAGKIKKDFVISSIEWLKNQGFNVILGKHVFDVYNQFAGKDDDRATDLQEALNDPEASMIVCARGGYGTVRVINKLDFSKFLEKPKWLVGFSDITVLHNRLNWLKVASIHEPMLRHFPKPESKISESINSLFSILEGKKQKYISPKNKLNREGKATAEMVGGNLSIIFSMRGTTDDLDTEGRILFLEDVGEYLYHTDRMIQNLKLGGKLDKLAGLVVGKFSRMKDNSISFGRNAYEIIYDAVSEYSYPVCFGFPAGHNKKNLALAFGMKWELKVSEKESSLKLM